MWKNVLNAVSAKLVAKEVFNNENYGKSKTSYVSTNNKFVGYSNKPSYMVLKRKAPIHRKKSN
ncbi:hypothetical protein, partial [Salmonella enterica]|uniref:hypothetical protein n=1 Tax=Salmonella enterica TaxID=28901 RepID=UPI001F243A4C